MSSTFVSWTSTRRSVIEMSMPPTFDRSASELSTSRRLSSPTRSCERLPERVPLTGQQHVDQPEDVLLVEGVEEVVGRRLGRAGAAGRRVAGDPRDGEDAGADDRHRPDGGGDDLAARAGAALGRGRLDGGHRHRRHRLGRRAADRTAAGRSRPPAAPVGVGGRGALVGLRGLPASAVGHGPRPPDRPPPGAYRRAPDPAGEFGAGTSPRRAARTLSDVRVAVTGSHGLIGTALLARAAGRRARGRAHRARRRPRAGEIGWDPRAGRLEPRVAGRSRRRREPGRRRHRRQAMERRVQAHGAGVADPGHHAARRHDGGPGRRPAGAAVRVGDRVLRRSRRRRARRDVGAGHRVPRRGRRGVGGGDGTGVGGRAPGRPPAHRHRAAPDTAGRCRGCCRCSSSASAGASGTAASG